MISLRQLVLLLLASLFLSACASTSVNHSEGSDIPNWFRTVTPATANRLISSSSNIYLMKYRDFYPSKNKNKYKLIKDFGYKLGNYAGVFKVVGGDKVELRREFHLTQKSLGTSYEEYESPFLEVYEKNKVVAIYSFSGITDSCLEEYLDRVSRKILQGEPRVNIFNDNKYLIFSESKKCSFMERNVDDNVEGAIEFAKYIVDKFIEMEK